MSRKTRTTLSLLLLLMAACLLAGCATRTDLELTLLEAKSYTRSQVRGSTVDLIDSIDAVERRIDDIYDSVLEASDIRREMHRSYWIGEINKQQQALDALRREVLGEP